MNHIKKFGNFNPINELKWDTYRNAAKKLAAMGHKNRSAKLIKHSFIVGNRDLGEFNVNAIIYEKLSMNYLKKEKEKMLFVANSEIITSDGDLKINKDKSKTNAEYATIVDRGPIPVYISGIAAMDPIEEYGEDEITECDHINIFINAIPSKEDRISESFELFGISVKIEWIDGKFIINDDEPASLFELGDEIIKFSDRRSAIKFKNIFDVKNSSKIESMGERIEDFFYEYSTHNEWVKFFQKIKSINTNLLYN